PPLFVLIAEGAVAQPRAQLERHVAWIAAALAVLAIAAAPALIWPLPAFATYFAAEDAWWRGLGALGALAAAGIAAIAMRGIGPERRAAAVAGAFAFAFTIAALAFPTGDESRVPGRWLDRTVDPVPADAIVVADRNLVHAVCWHLRREDVHVVWSPG